MASFVALDAPPGIVDLPAFPDDINASVPAPPLAAVPRTMTVTPAAEPVRCSGGLITDPSAFLNCVHIEGDLILRNTELTNLDAFSNVASISKAGRPATVEISHNARLTSLAGLSALQSTVGRVVIRENEVLTSLHGLDRLKSADQLVIAGNAALEHIDALGGMAGELSKGVVVANNPKLTSLAGLGLITDGGATADGVCLRIHNNPLLPSLDGLGALTSCAAGGVTITNCAALADVSALAKLAALGQDGRGISLELSGLPQLASTGTAFGMLTELAGGLHIRNAAALAAPGMLLERLVRVGAANDGTSLRLEQLPALELGTALSALAAASGSVVVHNVGVTQLAFASLTAVGRDLAGRSLSVRNNAKLGSLTAARLRAAPGALVLVQNTALVRAAFARLDSLGTNTNGISLAVDANAALTNLRLGALASCTGAVLLLNNDALRAANLDSLTTIGRSMTDGNSIEVVGNAVLETIGVAVEELVGALRVEDNPALTALPRAKTVGKNLQGQSLIISHNPSLKELSPLTGLAGAVAGSIVITHNVGLELLLGLDGVTGVGADASQNSLVIAHNTVLKSLEGLRACTTLEGALVLQENPGLVSLDGLQELTAIRGANILGNSIHIYGNPALVALHGLHNLHGALAGAISIANNDQLASLESLEGITGVAAPNAFGNAVSIMNNKRIEDLLGLQGLVGTLNGAVTISQNGGLKSLEGLCGVRAVAGKDLGNRSITVSSNPLLEDVRCLGNVGGALPGGITIDENQALTSVAPLKGERPISAIGGALIVNLVHCISAGDMHYLKQLCASSTACHANVEKANKCAPTASGNALVGTGQGRTCGGTASSAWSSWKLSGSSGLYLDVNTTACQFDLTPAYVTSLTGDAAHWQLVGVNSIYKPTKDGFRVYLWHPVLKGEYLRFFATRYKWSMSWLADTGRSAGITRAGKSGWKQFSRDTIYVDVDTSACNYGSTPSLVTALHGAADHWRTQGSHAIYKATATGFRVYVSHMSSEAITAAKAEEMHWAVSWVGATDNAVSGMSSPESWQAFCASRTNACAPVAQYYAVYTDVDTSAKNFRGQVSYVTSVSGAGNHLQVTGGASIYRATNKGFRLYLDRAPSPKVVIESGWRVNYIAYEAPIPCTVSVWSTWSSCSHLCGVGSATRTRVVTSPNNRNGSCPSLTEQKYCNQHACNTDCVVSSWGEWGTCSASCGSGFQTRVRVVTRKGLSGGKGCPALSQSQYCNNGGPCPVHCTVSRWSDWGACSRSCGSGRRTRARLVIQHAANAGAQCPALTSSEPCATQGCPVDCKLSAFGTFTPCDAPNGNAGCVASGTQSATRTVVVAPANGGTPCDALTSHRVCGTKECPSCSVQLYSAFGACSVSCGAGGIQAATLQAKIGGCPERIFRACPLQLCPVDCRPSAWSAWGRCTKDCGGGTTTRTRSLIAATYGGKVCGASTETAPCNEQACPAHCQVGAWSEWGACTKTCGGGVQSATRTVVSHAKSGGFTCPALTMMRPCRAGACPADCVVAPWGSWSTCSSKCGAAGSKTRTREVLTAVSGGGRACPVLAMLAKCGRAACPSPCTLAAWGSWSTCSTLSGETATCGKGVQRRHRTVAVNSAHGGGKCPPLTETKPCTEACCPGTSGVAGKCARCPRGTYQDKVGQLKCIPCTGGTYQVATGQTSCERCPAGSAGIKIAATSAMHCIKCPAGRVARFDGSTECLHCASGTFAAPGTNVCVPCATGKFTNNLSGQTACYNIPQPCTLTQWGEWSTCSRTCGGGMRTRARKIVTQSRFGAPACPQTMGMEPCADSACAVDCEYQAWSSWTTCDKSCGGGAQTRSRVIGNTPLFGGKVCEATLLTESRVCAPATCPVDCIQDSWGSWTTCSQPCGKGVQARTRKTTPPTHGGAECRHSMEAQSCYAGELCPVNCVPGAWGSWSTCDQTCGTGSSTRTRPVSVAAAHGGEACSANEEARPCNVFECPVDCGDRFTEWSVCTKTCGGGKKTREVLTTGAARHGGKTCGKSILEVPCNSHACPVHCEVSDWMNWSKCTTWKSCGKGTQQRHRVITKEWEDGGAVCPYLHETRICGTPCAVDCQLSAFSAWGKCSRSCGGGEQQRSRRVLTAAQFEGTACGVTTESRSCEAHACPVDCVEGTTWTEWTGCSKSCGTGHKERRRSGDKSPAHGGKRCSNTLDQAHCGTEACPLDCKVGAWAAWTACSLTCGTAGVQRRTRALVQALHGGKACPISLEQRACNRAVCAIDCKVEPFTAWSTCTTSCGAGTQSRSRTLTSPRFGGQLCPVSREQRECTHGACAVHCTVTAFSRWSSCSKLCGKGGVQNRSRTVIRAAAHGGYVCPFLEETRTCNAHRCPYEANVHVQGELRCANCDSLTDSEKTGLAAAMAKIVGVPTASVAVTGCNGRHHVKVNVAVTESFVRASAGSPAKGSLLEELFASIDESELHANTVVRTLTNTFAIAVGNALLAPGIGAEVSKAWGGKFATCAFSFTTVVKPQGETTPVGVEHCDFSLFSSWSACSKQCGGGVQFKTRKVLSTPLHGGRSCPSTMRVERPCRALHCPDDCTQSDLGPWTRCSKTCGAGTRARVRITLKPAAFGGKQCAPTRETELCNTESCPVDCSVHHWTAWTACSKSCGFGLRGRERTVAQVPLGGGQPCPHLIEKMECDAGNCPVDCAVTTWGTWTECTAACGGGTAVRSRTVSPSTADAQCPSTTDVMDCNVQPCAVDCSQGTWGAWSECTQPCGGGTQKRVRDTLVAPAEEGKACEQSSESQTCNSDACPVDCVIGAWATWTTCPVTCGGAHQSRVRSALVQPKFGGKLCPSFTEVQTCGQSSCPIVCKPGAWSVWSVCDRTCGTGHSRRSRAVKVGAKYGGAACDDLTAIRDCHTKPCPVDCMLGAWSDWGVCSTTCGRGHHSRQRTILREPAAGGKTCDALAEMAVCENRDCGPTIAVMPPIDCALSAWSAWGECTATCGMGVRHRRRSVVQAARGGKKCGALEQVSACAPQACPVDCRLTDWNLGPCSVSCGAGTSIRARSIRVAAAHGGNACAKLTVNERCDAGPCPVNCRVSTFGAWSTCTATCGGGLQQRSRYVTSKAIHGGVLCPALREARACGALQCPVNCQTSAWQEWSNCTKSCGTGRKWRIRSIRRQALSGGAFCGHTTEERACNTNNCPGDCIMGAWTWGACSKTCGSGRLKRTRPVIQNSFSGGVACGARSEWRNCNESPCPVHCATSKFTAWSICTKTCGGGSKRRSRTITTTAKHGGYACPPLIEHRDCASRKCPIDCVVTSWGSWEACTVSCGGGAQKRARLGVERPKYGGKVCPAASVSRMCNEQPCPVNCELAAWDVWTVCSKTCGNGQQRRVRSMIVQPANGGAACLHRAETRTCGTGPCPIDCWVSPWGQWSSCTQTCGSGEQTRTRHITSQVQGSALCPSLVETVDCATDPCPAVHCQVTPFSAWSVCGKSCGGSTQTRTRSIVKVDEYGGKACPHAAETRTCGTQLCPVHCTMSSFSNFTPCSRTCGNDGVQARERTILVHPLRNGTPCQHTHETATCNTRACPIDCEHTDYTSFDSCSTTCGWGWRTRTLSIVVSAAFGGKSCPETVHRKPCQIVACPVHCKVTPFGLWSGCTRTCGGDGGWQSRTRKVETASADGGALCPHVAETRRCGNIVCPIDCIMTTWGSYDTCSTSCGKGFYKRSRKVDTREAWGGQSCPHDVQTSDCNAANPCPVHCRVSPWEGWSRCSKTCGTGRQARSRFIVVKASAGGYVCPSLVEERTCNRKVCPIDCKVGLWQPWTSCTKSCGWGVSHQIRAITTKPKHGGRGCPLTKNSRTCNEGACPVDCVASQLSNWGSCSVTCGKPGKQERHRTLLTHPMHGGKVCPKMIEVQDCYLGACPVDCEVSAWASWSPCTKSCGVGKQRRSRSVTRKLLTGGSVCPYLKASRGCNLQSCPINCILSKWGSYAVAAYTKGDTAVMLRRSRDVLIVAAHGGKPCGATVQSKKHICKEQDREGLWGGCSEACGAGYRYRYREHVRCSLTAAVKYHVRFRQGEHCFERACKPGEASGASGDAPAVSSSAMRLDESVGQWQTLSAAEASGHGLPPGHWQKAL
jgi:hypothetical protein